MRNSRREFLVTAAATGTITLLPFSARAADVFKSAAGDFTVHPVAHASFVLETPAGVIYSDPVGDPALYAELPAPDLILVTHRHGDHYNAETLAALGTDSTPIITCQDVLDQMPDGVKERAGAMGHDAGTEWNGVSISAIPAYNLDPERQNFHPKDRGDNGFVLGFDGFTVYISGDTEDIPEMRALEGIDLAFLCMNLPFTMTAEAAASAVAEFRPKYVYPYHYRGRDGGTQDPKAFAEMVGDAAEVKLVDWYPDDDNL